MLEGIRLAMDMGRLRGLGFGFGLRFGEGRLAFSSVGPRRASVRMCCRGLGFGAGGGVCGACGAASFGDWRRWPIVGLRAARVNRSRARRLAPRAVLLAMASAFFGGLAVFVFSGLRSTTSMDFGNSCLGNGLLTYCHVISIASSTWQATDATKEALQRFLSGVYSGLSIGFATQTGSNASEDGSVDPSGNTGGDQEWRQHGPYQHIACEPAPNAPFATK